MHFVLRCYFDMCFVFVFYVLWKEFACDVHLEFRYVVFN